MPYYRLFEKNPKTARGVTYTCGCVTSSGTNRTPVEIFPPFCIKHNQPADCFFVHLERNPYPSRH